MVSLRSRWFVLGFLLAVPTTVAHERIDLVEVHASSSSVEVSPRADHVIEVSAQGSIACAYGTAPPYGVQARAVPARGEDAANWVWAVEPEVLAWEWETSGSQTFRVQGEKEVALRSSGALTIPLTFRLEWVGSGHGSNVGQGGGAGSCGPEGWAWEVRTTVPAKVTLAAAAPALPSETSRGESPVAGLVLALLALVIVAARRR